MKSFKKKEINEMVGGDMMAGANDKPFANDSEIETGPISKDPSSDSYYEKGISPTTDQIVNRYRQNIPWFAVYTYAGGYRPNTQNETKILKKQSVEEEINDLVKKCKSNDVSQKDFDFKFNKIINYIENTNLSDEQISNIETIIDKKKTIKETNSNLKGKNIKIGDTKIDYQTLAMRESRLKKAKENCQKNKNCDEFNRLGGETELKRIEDSIHKAQNNDYQRKKGASDAGFENRFKKEHTKDRDNSNPTKVGGIIDVGGNTYNKIMTNKETYK